MLEFQLKKTCPTLRSIQSQSKPLIPLKIVKTVQLKDWHAKEIFEYLQCKITIGQLERPFIILPKDFNLIGVLSPF